jgi:rod shape-determining protein MreC
VSIEFSAKGREARAVFVLIPLLIMHLVLLSLQIADPAGVLLIRKWVLMTQSPFINISSQISAAVRSVWTNYIELHGTREENSRLQETIRQLSLQQQQMEEMREENNRLHQLLSVTQLSPITTLGARVVARTPDFLSNVLYIDRGQKDGIRLNAPVMSGLGIVGRIVLVSNGDSQVQLITNPDASIGVMLEKTRLPGVLRGSGNSLLEMNYISNTEQVEAGDLVVTSGLDGVYPKGLPVGRVVESRKGNSVFLIIKVEPSTDLIHLEEVSVMNGGQKKEI